VGELLGEVLRSLLGFYGTVIIGFAILGTAVILRTPWTLEEAAQAFVRLGHAAWAKVQGVFVALREAWAEARELHEEEIRVSQPRIMGMHFDDDDEPEVKPPAPVVMSAPRPTAPAPRAARHCHR